MPYLNVAATNHLVFSINKILPNFNFPRKLKTQVFKKYNIIQQKKKTGKVSHNLPLGWSWSHTGWSVTSLSFVTSSFAESDTRDKQNL